MKRRDFFSLTLAGSAALSFSGGETSAAPDPLEEPAADKGNASFYVKSIRADPIASGDRHTGVDTLLRLKRCCPGARQAHSRAACRLSGRGGHHRERPRRRQLSCDTSSAYDDDEARANAEDESHSFPWLVDSLVLDPRVSACLLDGVRTRFISQTDHASDGYRVFENASFPLLYDVRGPAGRAP
jgi:hypothetical protein